MIINMDKKGMLMVAKAVVVGSTVVAGYCYGKVQYYNGRIDAANDIKRRVDESLIKAFNQKYIKLDKSCKEYFDNDLYRYVKDNEL